MFFSEEKNQRLLQIQVFVPPNTTATASEKVSCFFSSEKKTFSSLAYGNTAVCCAA
jgi:hypothetical protein